MAHLHLGLLAYWVVNTVRHQLKGGEAKETAQVKTSIEENVQKNDNQQYMAKGGGDTKNPRPDAKTGVRTCYVKWGGVTAQILPAIQSPTSDVVYAFPAAISVVTTPCSMDFSQA